MRVGTWNVAYGRGPIRNARRCAEFAKPSSYADVWILTETHDSLSPGDSFLPLSSSQRPGVGEIEGVVEGSRWVSIWSPHPMSQVTVADPERTAAAIVTIGSTELLVYATVLPWYNDVERKGMAAELASQGAEWVDLSQKHPGRCCVAGDFNVNLGGAHYYGSKANRQLVLDRLAAADLQPVTTFDDTKGHFAEHGLVDHIALSTRLARTASVVTVIGQANDDGHYMSDHHGVIVEFIS